MGGPAEIVSWLGATANDRGRSRRHRQGSPQRSQPAGRRRDRPSGAVVRRRRRPGPAGSSSSAAMPSSRPASTTRSRQDPRPRRPGRDRQHRQRLGRRLDWTVQTQGHPAPAPTDLGPRQHHELQPQPPADFVQFSDADLHANATASSSHPSTRPAGTLTRAPSHPQPFTTTADRRLQGSAASPMSVSSAGDFEGGERSLGRGRGGLRRGEFARPGTAERADREIAPAGQDLRGGADPDLGGVLGEGHIPHLVQACSIAQHPPMRSTSRTGLAWAKANW
jgi:hypothetical protein